MNITGEHLASLQDLGYSGPEARFLYLVATYSGYFTLRPFVNFRKQPKGWYVTEFTKKIRRLRHARVTVYARNTYMFNLYSRRLYAAIDKENLRNRRRLSNELIRRRLYVLDFVLANPDHRHLETEGDKVRYFHETLGPVVFGRFCSQDVPKSWGADRCWLFLSERDQTSRGACRSCSYANRPLAS